MINQEVSNWLNKAFTDYKTIVKLLDDQDDEIVTESVCFHSQQFAEKALKAFLISRKIDFKRNHDIVYLLNLC
jgi:HEPN domain-containing protein